MRMLHSAHLRSVAAGLVALAAIIGVTAAAAYSQKASAATTVSAGDLIRGESFSAVYYMGADGFRYVFPNEKTYFTWYSDFDDVKFITDAQLGEIQIGGNVTYKPGVKMIKINTDPRVYVVSQGGVLHHVDDETTASTLYGSSWNRMIDDVPDGFFSNYTIEETSANDVDYDADDAESSVSGVNDDKGLVAPEEIEMDDMMYSPIDVTIDAGNTVRFTNNDSVNHTVTGDNGRWGSGTMLPGESYVIRFSEAGTYTFYCSYHPEMTGAVYVE